MKHRLFVYGTLKQGQGRSVLLDGQTFLGEAQTEPHYRLFSCGPFPCLVEAGVKMSQDLASLLRENFGKLMTSALRGSMPLRELMQDCLSGNSSGWSVQRRWRRISTWGALRGM